MLSIFLSVGLLMMAIVFAICLRAYWKFFHLTNEHRRKLEWMIVEIIKRMPLEPTKLESGDYGIQVLLYNCHFRKSGRTYNVAPGDRWRKMPFLEWFKAGVPSENNYPVLFLKDGLFHPGSYQDFLDSIGVEYPAADENESVNTAEVWYRSSEERDVSIEK